MALFKILKGDSSRISTDVTPFHDGYAYFTPDDGGLNSSGSTAVSVTLLSGGWSSGEQTLQISGVTAESNGVIGLSQSVSDAEMEAAKNAELYVCGQGTGTITIAAYGETPTRDIPVVVILLG